LGVEYQVIVRNRGRRDSLLLLAFAAVLGFLPVAAYFTNPMTTFASVILGAVLGVPLFALSLRRLFTMEALTLSADGATLAVYRRTLFGRTRFDIPTSDVRKLRLLGGTRLEIWRGSGPPVALGVEEVVAGPSSLRALAYTLRVPLEDFVVSDD
jgi:hypothetical protein